jgi:ABC-type polysaccharide/polyol phosphate export permease
MAGLITAYRQALFYGEAPDLRLLLAVAAIAVLVLLIGSLVFRRLSPYFAEEV